MAPPQGKLECVITYLEMTERPASPTPLAPPGRLALIRAEAPTVPFYRFLYETVGTPWLWYERRLLDDDALERIIHHPKIEIYVLYLGGVPVGYSELDLRRMPDVELSYFGLMPEFIGRGFGRYHLRRTVDQAWLHAPQRVWAHTCSLDHPRALGLYQRTGFVPYRQATMIVDDPRATGLIPA